MPGLDPVAERASHHRLAVMGAFHAGPDDGVEGKGTLVLLGPLEPGFWGFVSRTPEFADGNADPLDRWSARVITGIATDLGGTALFPFGQPARPFISWALASQRAWSSPVGLLVHDNAGLMVSYRGAVLLPELLDLPAASVSPCLNCEAKPCLDACPAQALTGQGYDLKTCHAFLDTTQGQGCMEAGCLVRRACPLSRAYARDPAQSAYHMRQFH